MKNHMSVNCVDEVSKEESISKLTAKLTKGIHRCEVLM
jgi:hypothetical protein